jgi:mono/diheme cytochrome c family protein
MHLSLEAAAHAQPRISIAPRNHPLLLISGLVIVALTTSLNGLGAIGAAQATDPVGIPAGEHAKAPVQAAAALYRRFCQRCHAVSGQGDPGAGFSGIPNFTDPAWQTRRSDAQLLVSILDGKGDGMPTFRGRVTEAQARELVGHIRAFGPERPRTTSGTSGFEAKFRELDEEFQELQRQFRELQSAPRTPERHTAVQPAQGASGAREITLKAGASLFRRYCQRCHGADGKGDGDSTDGPPDFTYRAWQQRRSDVRLLTSILDGKGMVMPAFRKRLTEEQAADLIDYIRALLPPRQPSARHKDEPR